MPAGHFDYCKKRPARRFIPSQNYKQEPFSVESLRTLSIPGIVFLLDVPRVADPVRVFDQMRLTAKRMTQTLEGVLVDDNGGRSPTPRLPPSASRCRRRPKPCARLISSLAVRARLRLFG